MRFFYSLVMYLLTPLLVIRLWWKGRKLPAYRHRIAERFMLGCPSLGSVDVWVHAVSLGEVIAATPLIDRLLQQQQAVFITTMTPTGSQRVVNYFGHKVGHQYVPYDMPGVVKRFFKKTKPKVGIIMETELWPNLIHQAQRAKVPLILANARISDDSIKAYQRIQFLIKPVLNKFTAIFPQGDDDARRFIKLGAPANKVHTLGNMKFDLNVQMHNPEGFHKLKESWGASRITLIAASTHDNEEALILDVFKELQDALPNILLLIAPRHPERFQSVYQLSLKEGYRTGLRSDLSSINPDKEVIILDSLGELLGMYQISDYAFIGGSLVPVGGHNVLEAVAMRIPVFSGKNFHNFKYIFSELQEKQAINLIDNAHELMQGIIRLERNQEERERLITQATQVLAKNQGAVARHVEFIKQYL